MDITVKANKVKTSPKKMRLVINQVKRLDLIKAKAQLKYSDKEASIYIYELLKSGVAACKEQDMDLNDCAIKSLVCNDGPALKRRRIVERGRATAIRKRSCHVTLVLTDNKSDKDKNVKKSKKVSKKDK